MKDINPEEIEGTPQAAQAESTGEPPKAEYVDLAMRKKVNRLKNGGLVCVMGPDWEGGLIRIRPWTARAVQMFRRKYEDQLRHKNPKIKQNDDLPAAEEIELNRATAVMSLTGIECSFRTPDGEIVKLTMPEIDDEEAARSQRAFVSQHLLPPHDPETGRDETDMDFLELLMSLNRGLQKVAYEEIDRLGKKFVYGANEALDYSD